MSLIRIAVGVQQMKLRLSIQDLLKRAYFQRYGQPMPSGNLNDDAKKWESGVDNIPYLYDYIFHTEGSL